MQWTELCYALPKLQKAPAGSPKTLPLDHHSLQRLDASLHGYPFQRARSPQSARSCPNGSWSNQDVWIPTNLSSSSHLKIESFEWSRVDQTKSIFNGRCKNGLKLLSKTPLCRTLKSKDLAMLQPHGSFKCRVISHNESIAHVIAVQFVWDTCGKSRSSRSE